MNMNEILNKKANEKIILNDLPLVELIFTGREYDFTAYIENNANKDVVIILKDYDKKCVVKAKDWIGLFEKDIEKLLNSEYKVMFI